MTVRTLPVTGTGADVAHGRLDFLDALRGIAVALVLAQHVGELLFPAMRQLTASGVQLGQLGVLVFFLCSGFIIPASLERCGSQDPRRTALARFWTSRVFRLYPLYWLSLAAAGVLVAAGLLRPAEGLGAGDWLANATMLQALAGSPHALDLYWTLGLELLFYLGVSGLFLLGLHRHSAALSVLASAGCLAAAGLAQPLLGRPAPLALFCVATMFTGTVFFRWFTGSASAGTLAGCVGTALAGGTALLASRLGSAAAGEPGLVPMLSAWLGAYAIFGTGLLLRRRAVPAWLRRLGTISFSVYLVQALVLAAVPALPWAWATAALWIAATLAVSEATYRWVERPAIALGRGLGARIPARTEASLPTRMPAPRASRSAAAAA